MREDQAREIAKEIASDIRTLNYTEAKRRGAYDWKTIEENYIAWMANKIWKATEERDHD